MFKLICELIDNELISVPSSRRAGMIHKKCFEYRSNKYHTYYLTLDCRKWAPKSNPEKYLSMVLGMQEVLPDDFVKSVFNVFIKWRSKEVHTRSEVVTRLLTNEGYKNFRNDFTFNEETGSAFFTMPYSFVMGIFNMLSSLLHAGGQLYAKYLIETPYLTRGENLNFDMFAHSDDSGGRCSIPSQLEGYAVMQSILGSYEMIMKSLNHLMSTKKCSVGRSYFELVSILYMNHELLPLLPKFLSNISMNFTGKGLSSDMKQVISKSIELQMNGSTASQAYKCQVIMSNMFRNFYRVIHDMQLPALGGFVNTWPTFYLSHGSQADDVRICRYNYNLYKKIASFATDYLDYEITDGTFNLKYQQIIRFPVAYRSFKKKITLPIFEDSQWFFEQNKTRHSRLNVLWFRAKLESSDFAVALLNINEVKRAFDSLYMASGKHIRGKAGYLYSIEDVILGIMSAEAKDSPLESSLRVMCAGMFKFFDFLEGLDSPYLNKINPMSIKPCSLQLNDFIEAPIQEYNSLDLAIQLVKPELSKYTYSNKRFGSELTVMGDYLKNRGVHWDLITVKNFLDYMRKLNNTVINYYSAVQSSDRQASSYNGLFKLLLNNFHSSKKTYVKYGGILRRS